MTARISISLPQQDLDRLDAMAAEQGLSRSEFVREATEHYIADADSIRREEERQKAGQEFLEFLEDMRSMPAMDDRPTLEILRELRGPLGATPAWDDDQDDIP